MISYTGETNLSTVFQTPYALDRQSDFLDHDYLRAPPHSGSGNVNIGGGDMYTGSVLNCRLNFQGTFTSKFGQL